MALFAANATGNWSATATWAAVRNVPTIHATTNRTVSAGGIVSAAFTAPNTTNYVTGVLVYVSGVGTAGNLVATLRESGIDTAATVTIAITSLKTGGWMYMKLATPYQYTTTGAGAYAWKLNTSGASGTTSVADIAAATSFAYMSADDLVPAVPTTGDDVFFAGNNLAAILVTVDNASAACGSGAATGTPTARNVTAAANCSHSSGPTFSTAANSTLTVKGQIEVAVDGVWNMGTVATPVPSSYVAKLVLNQNGTDLNYDVSVEATGNWKMQGAAPTAKRTRFVSGTGTAADPLILLADMGLAVDDEIAITGQGSYDQDEKRFIKTINSATSVVLSSTAGGAEAALTYAHDSDDRIYLLTRNVRIESSTTTEHWCFANKATVAGAVDIDHAMTRYCGGATLNRRGWQMSVNGVSQRATADDFVMYLPDGWGFSDTTSTTAETYTDVLAYGNTTASNVGSIVTSGAKNKDYTDCHAVGNNAIGFYFATGGNFVLTRCEGWNNNSNNNLAGGMRLDSMFTLTFNDFVCQSNRTRGIYLNNVAKVSFDSMLAGNYGSNAIDVDVASDTYNDATFRTCKLSSATKVGNYLNMIPGSELKFDRLDDTDWNHRWYTAYGINSASGPDCTDTTTVQADHHSVRMAPEDSATGITYEYNVLARPGYFVTAQGLAQKNASMVGGAVTVSLFLPDSTSADATVTMADDTNPNPFNIGAAYSGTDTKLATVRVNAKSSTAGAYTFVGKLFNGTNALTSMDTWSDGKPAQIMYPELGDPDSVWAVLFASFTTPGTVGYYFAQGYRLTQRIFARWL